MDVFWELGYMLEILRCWDIDQEDVNYYGGNINASGILRFSQDYEMYHDCNTDTELLLEFSKRLNLQLIYIPAVSGGTGWSKNIPQSNVSIDKLIRNETDYYGDYAELNDQNYFLIDATPTINEIYNFNFAMRKLPAMESYGIGLVIDVFDWVTWKLLFISLLVVILISVATERFHQNILRKNKKTIFSSFREAFEFYGGKVFDKNEGSTTQGFPLSLVSVWLISIFILTQAFFGILQSHLINQPLKWYKTIDDLANAPDDFKIFVEKNSQTHQLLEEYSRINSSYAIVNQKASVVSFDDILHIETLTAIFRGKSGVIFTSYNIDNIRYMQREIQKVSSLDEIKLAKTNDVRLVRKDYEFGYAMLKIAKILLETGFSQHWLIMNRMIPPIIFRAYGKSKNTNFWDEFGSRPEDDIIILLYNIYSIFVFALFGWILSLLVCIYEIEINKFNSKRN